MNIDGNYMAGLAKKAFDAAHQKNLPRPLSPEGALAALLVVERVLAIEDAANAVRVTPAALVREAQGWAAGATLNNPSSSES
jgi:hypothetical protein